MIIGETVGSYRLIQKLGEGGMGEVYLAEHKYIARRAAIKFLLPEFTGAPDVVGRFFAEARAASLIEHPGIVEVVDCEIHKDGRAYIVMEHLRGESLRAYLDRAAKLDGDPAGALAILRQIALALAAAHAQGIVHRDLKPDNVFLHLPVGRSPASPVVKILDFGIAKLLGPSGEERTKTRTGQLLGTPLYMSPEQCRGARLVDSLSDVYAFGCIMYEMFCGRPPFVADGFGDLIIAHVSQPPPEPLDLAPAMSPLVRRTLLACLAKDPRKRPASMESLAASLTEEGASDVIDLRRPIEPGSPVDGQAASSGAPSPLVAPARPGAASATPSAPGPAAQPVTEPVIVMTAEVGGTRLLPTKPTTFGATASEIIAARSDKSGKRAGAAIAGGAALAVALGVAWKLAGHPTPPPPESQAPIPAPQSVTAAGEGPTRQTPAPEPQLFETSSIALKDLPAGARVRLDGRITTSPLTVRRGDSSHVIVVDAEGYEPFQLTVDGSKDRTVSVAMKPKAASVSASPAAGPSEVKPHHRSERRHGSPAFSGFTDL
jgi:eukaryotic-like serine/threonine-protein kinase